MNTADNFYDGKITEFNFHWEELTTNDWILDIVNGYEIEFDQLPVQQSIPHPSSYKF